MKISLYIYDMLNLIMVAMWKKNEGVALAICKFYLDKNVQKVNGTVGLCDGS